MAIDTRSKRQSAIGVTLPWLRTPDPDTAFSQGDRQHIAWSYSGILAGGAVEVPPVYPLPAVDEHFIANLKVYNLEARMTTYELVANRAALEFDASVE